MQAVWILVMLVVVVLVLVLVVGGGGGARRWGWLLWFYSPGAWVSLTTASRNRNQFRSSQKSELDSEGRDEAMRKTRRTGW